MTGNNSESQPREDIDAEYERLVNDANASDHEPSRLLKTAERFLIDGIEAIGIPHVYDPNIVKSIEKRDLLADKAHQAEHGANCDEFTCVLWTRESIKAELLSEREAFMISWLLKTQINSRLDLMSSSEASMEKNRLRIYMEQQQMHEGWLNVLDVMLPFELPDDFDDHRYVAEVNELCENLQSSRYTTVVYELMKIIGVEKEPLDHDSPASMLWAYRMQTVASGLVGYVVSLVHRNIDYGLASANIEGEVLIALRKEGIQLWLEPSVSALLKLYYEESLSEEVSDNS